MYRDDIHIAPVPAIHHVHNGKRGRPSKVIDPLVLRDALSPSRNISKRQLAKLFNVNRNTLNKYTKLYGITKTYSTISNQALDTIVRQYSQERPDSGQSYLMGLLLAQGIKIPRHRLRSAVHRVNSLGTQLRKRQQVSTIPRQPYIVSRPNALWHIDGHHKLIHWGIVLHGCVDGYSRTVRKSFSHCMS